MANARFASKKDLFAVVCPQDKPMVEVWHSTTAGFGARIMRANKRTGSVLRTYLARWRATDGKDNKHKLGTFEDLSYEDAQMKAMESLRAAKHESKTGERSLPTLADALTAYIAERIDTISDTTAEDYRKRWGYLKAHHDTNVLALSSMFWMDEHVRLLQFGRPTADGVMRVAHAVYQSLMDDERLTENPVKRVASKKSIFKHGKIRSEVIHVHQLPVLWRWLETRAHVSVRDWVRIALMMGLRDAVLGNLRWENVDMRLQLLKVPAEERGNKSKVLAAMPIPDWLFANVFVPRNIARLPGEPWVIPSTRKAGEPLVDVRGSMATFEAESGGIHVGPHKLRRTFSTVGFQATGSMLTVGRLLTHTHKAVRVDEAEAVTAGYVSTASEALRLAINQTEGLMLHMCGVDRTKVLAEDSPNTLGDSHSAGVRVP